MHAGGGWGVGGACRQGGEGGERGAGKGVREERVVVREERGGGERGVWGG